jgi:uncharacterized protein (TIGR04255 family)
MPVGRYAKPPITEAVIEFRFGSPISGRSLSRFLRNVAREYPITEQTYAVSAQFRIVGAGQQPQVRPEQTLTGYKLTGRDEADLVLLGFDRIASVRLAPYHGWEDFLEKAKANYEALRKISGHRTLVRIATRYVNRLDIPTGRNAVVRTEDYLKVEPGVPSAIPKLNHFFTSFLGIVPEVEGQVIVNSGTVLSPLIDNVSLLLDIDLFTEQKLPQRDQDIWGLLTRLRAQKNLLFEAFITDQARELFDRA